MPPRLKADKDKAVVLAFFQQKRDQGRQLLEVPPTSEAEELAFFYAMQDLYSVVFKAIHRAFNDPDDLIGRLNRPVAWSDGRQDYTHRERLADHLEAIDEVISLLKG